MKKRFSRLLRILPQLCLLVKYSAPLHHLQELNEGFKKNLFHNCLANWFYYSPFETFLRKLYCAVPIQVNLHDEVVELVLGGVLAHGSHHVEELLRTYSTASILSKKKMFSSQEMRIINKQITRR